MVSPRRYPYLLARLGTILRTVNVDAAREVGVAPGRPEVVEVNWVAGWAPGRSAMQRSCSARLNRKRLWIVLLLGPEVLATEERDRRS
jgi:hypothetical protein